MRTVLHKIGNEWKRLLFLIVLTQFATACVSPQLDQSIRLNDQHSEQIRQSDHENNNESQREAINKTIAIDEFIDLRPRKGTSDAMTWIGFIPGVVWLELLTEIPDSHTVATDYNAGSFTNAFSQGYYRYIKSKNIFKKVHYLPYDKYVSTDYRLEGVLHRTFLNEIVYYYGSGLYAWITRILSLPYVSYEFEIDLELRLRNLKTNQLVWRYRLNESGKDRYNSIYRLSRGIRGQNVISYNISRLLSRHNERILAGILDAMKRDR